MKKNNIIKMFNDNNTLNLENKNLSEQENFLDKISNLNLITKVKKYLIQ
jgi:hypothetical protein